MGMKDFGKDVLLLVGLMGILSVVCSYCLIYQPTMEKADALERENGQLQTTINDLSARADNREAYMAGTEEMKREVDAVYQRFPVEVREEDGILLAIQQELTAPMLVNSVNISACEPVTFPGTLEEDGEDLYEPVKTEEMPSLLMKRNVTIDYLVSYDGMKRSLENIVSQDNRMSIRQLTAAYDESTGLLRGAISVDMYCIPGQPGKEYVPPDFSSVLIGSGNLFGTIESVQEAQEMQAEAENLQEGAEE